MTAAPLAIDPDSVLMLRARDGEMQCLEELVEKHRRGLIVFLFRMVQSQAIAEELAQDVFVRVYRSHATYEPSAKFTSWLYRIATNVALNWLRDHRRQRRSEVVDLRPDRPRRLEVSDPRPTVDSVLLADVVRREVREAVAELPPRQRAAVVMHKYQGMDYVQIAAALNCTLPSVKSLLFRTYGTLRQRLAHLVAA
jgi:RNA polymerase sigma-70 factor, ECF subfamily